MFVNIEALKSALQNFKNNTPYDHCVVDGFLAEPIAQKIESEFLEYEDPRWFYYKNSIEDKKALNDWNAFPRLTYQLFNYLISPEFVKLLSDELGIPLYQDPGLHGGGWHIHGSGGNLNPHYDYSIHPKLGLQRRVNIIIYVSSTLDEQHGGHLGLYSHDAELNQPKDLVKVVQPVFNRAIIFDTTQNSWHGMCRPLVQPDGIYRKSLAIYYLTDPPANADPRERALFAPREEQKGDVEVAALIKDRADPMKYANAYRVSSGKSK